LNEEQTLPLTLADLPRHVDGFDTVEWLVIDDGSTDGTVRVAAENGVDHIISLSHNQCLAKAFMTGIETALKLGADVIVNIPRRLTLFKRSSGYHTLKWQTAICLQR
jgi:glycosyltransferase involved in cell wall biosynthesis